MYKYYNFVIYNYKKSGFVMVAALEDKSSELTWEIAFRSS